MKYIEELKEELIYLLDELEFLSSLLPLQAMYRAEVIDCLGPEHELSAQAIEYLETFVAPFDAFKVDTWMAGNTIAKTWLLQHIEEDLLDEEDEHIIEETDYKA